MHIEMKQVWWVQSLMKVWVAQGADDVDVAYSYCKRMLNPCMQ